MLDLEQIQEALKDRRVLVISEKTKLNPHTIYRVMRGEPTTYNTIKTLSDYLTVVPGKDDIHTMDTISKEA